MREGREGGRMCLEEEGTTWTSWRMWTKEKVGCNTSMRSVRLYDVAEGRQT